jgi:hypothetical protein
MRLEYTKLKTVNAVPEADSMIESFRAIGYTLSTAVADIIDNSIAAGAKNIWLTRIWDGEESSFCIKDDGCGMNAEEAIQAMRPGSVNPRSQREFNDLGRFGLGLKTASFSQCRRLTIYSHKKNYAKAAWTWDLDYVGQSKKWELLQWLPMEYADILDDIETGTAVIWTELDHIVSKGAQADDESARQKFSEQMDEMKNHIAMTFHRFIEDGDITIYWGETPIAAWDPFCKTEPKTQEEATDVIDFSDQIVNIKGYILPHKDDFSSPEAFNAAAGSQGYPAMQGFYVYRGKRLLLAGDWLGLFKKEEHYKLVRILIDLPNTLDSDWKLDIKKSAAVPPISCREFLRSYARKVRQRGVEVYRHRGRIIQHRAGKKFQEMWQEKKVGNSIHFVVNRKHAFVEFLKEMAKDNPEKAINMLLTFVEESVPSKSIYIKEAEGEVSESREASPELIKNLKIMAEAIYAAKRKDGTPEDLVKQELKLQAPFNEFEDLIDELHD